MKYKVLEDCFCEHYIHEKTTYPRKGLVEKKLKKDDEVELVKEWGNFYGFYLRVKKNNIEYDILPNNLKKLDI